MRKLFLLSLLSLTGCVHAQSVSNGGKISGGITMKPSGAVCQITTPSLPPAVVGTPYSAPMTTVNCPLPQVWTIVPGSGTLPTGLSLNGSTGTISGTPSVAGSSSFSVQVVDGLGIPAVFPAGLSITASGGTTPALPSISLLTWDTSVAGTPSPGIGVTVGTGSAGPCALTGGVCNFTPANFQAALTSLSCGSTIVIANVVYPVAANLNFNKVCDQAHYITVIRDTTDANFPAEGTRVTPCYSGIPSTVLVGLPAYPCPTPIRHMPYIQKTTAGAAINVFSTSYRFVGIEFGRNNSYDLDFGIITMANTASCTAPDLTCMNAQPTFNIFDRCIIHGDAQRQTVRAIGLGGTRWVAFKDSFVYDIGLTYLGGGGDAQPFGWGNGKNLTNSGFGIFSNSFLSASTECNLFCGSFTEPLSPSTGFDGVPQNIWFSQDWLYKNPLWDPEIGQTVNTPQNIEGVNYGPPADQEFIQTPTAIQVVPGQVYTVQTLGLNDLDVGINRSPVGTNTLTCGGGTCGTVATTFVTVGSGPSLSQSQFISKFTAPASPPPGGQTTYTRCFNTADSRLATLGANRNMCASTVFTIVAPGGASTPNFPTVGADLGGAVTWASPGNITANDGTYSTSSVSNLQVTNVLAGSGYNFSIPSTATINGIQVDVQEKEFNPSGASSDNSAKLMKAGTAVGSNLSAGAALVTAGSVHTFGGSANLWGTTWTPADINNSGFGFAFQAIGAAATSNGPGVDSVKITVTYTIALTNQMVLAPKAPDLKIQPSYTDSTNNRQFCLILSALPNFTTTTMTWKVDGVANGNSNIGQMFSATTAGASPGSNDQSAIYCSGNLFNNSSLTLGNHVLSVNSATGVSDTTTINVTTAAPILEADEKPFTVKNGFELKCGGKILAENLLIQNAWGSNGNGGGQGGQFFLIHPFNQNGCTGTGANCSDGNNIPVGYGPFYVADVTFRYIKGLNLGAGFVMGGSNNTLGIHRVSATHILCDTCSKKINSNGFASTYLPTQTNGGGPTVYSWESPTNPMMDNMTHRHITYVGDNPNTFGINTDLAQPLPINYVVQDSFIASPNSSTFINPNGNPPGSNACVTATGNGANNTIAKSFIPCFQSFTWDHLNLTDSTALASVFTPQTNITQVGQSSIGFVNTALGDYRLCKGLNNPAPPCTAASIFASGQANQASDSLDLGADIAGLQTVERNVRNGLATPMSITNASPLPAATHGVAYSNFFTVSGGTAPYTWTTTAGYVPSGAIDTLDYACMPLPNRNNFHLTGATVKYCVIDSGLMMWIKGNSGGPADGEMFDSRYIYQWYTEGPTFSNLSGYKMYVTPVPLWARYHRPGADDVVVTHGPNKYKTTESCGADGLPQIDNLDIQGELTGPFTDISFQTDCIAAGGSIGTCNVPDHTPYLLAQKFIKGTSGIYQTRERYKLALGFGQIVWDTSHLSGGAFVVDQSSTNETVVSGGNPTPNFACGIPNLPVVNGLPGGTILTSSPSMNLVDSTGELNGTPLAAGPATFTVQVEDAVGRIAQKTVTLPVN